METWEPGTGFYRLQSEWKCQQGEFIMPTALIGSIITTVLIFEMRNEISKNFSGK
jgi:hypothetical protein